jgi:hypothetical protein
MFLGVFCWELIACPEHACRAVLSRRSFNEGESLGEGWLERLITLMRQPGFSDGH